MRILTTAALVSLLAACARGPAPTPEQVEHKPLEELRVAAAATIKDPARAKDMANLVDRLEREIDESIVANRSHLKGLEALDANYDATEGDFRKLFADFNSNRAGRQGRVLALRDQMIAATTDEEWRELARARVRALESIVKPR